MTEWNDLFVATAGAAAALTGLLFVGISINLSKILAHQSLPTRASLALTLLMSILVFSIILLVPGEPFRFLGYVFSVLGFAVWFLVTRTDSRIFRRTANEYRRIFLLNILLDQLAVGPYFFGGLLLLFAGEAGLYLIVLAFVFSFAKAVLDAWVLLIEILR